ncbi:hypothetical protein BDZ94DRAFT_1307205 [Collybia nuda]|uniref:BTB domain-containing protein n=1 Tax=Collybia nuda TaxID=64659 RepID=A0A9P5YCH2_9AGAR|nr:hypothetical protein BDZ94DRAFT_1307205 [Collybia nuda]
MPRFIILDGTTIRENHNGEEERPKKRQRIDDDEPTKLQGSAPSRDSIYYFDSVAREKACVIQVEQTLFQISEDLFPLGSTIRSELQQYKSDGKRTSDKEPLLLLSASADGFRALLWALSIPSKDIDGQLEPTEEAQIHPLLALATITHTYRFTTLRDQALSAIERAFSDLILAETCPSTTFAAIIEISVKMNAPKLQKVVMEKWVSRLKRREIPALPAIAAADESGLRQLRGIAYYVHAQELLSRHPHVAGANVAQLFAKSQLNTTQTVCFLAGCMSLVTFWERLQRTPPKLPCLAGCGPAAHRACVVTWNEQWHHAATSKKTLRHGSTDILAILNTVREQLTADQELVEKVTPACRKGGLDALGKTAADLLQDLPNYFPAYT